MKEILLPLTPMLPVTSTMLAVRKPAKSRPPLPICEGLLAEAADGDRAARRDHRDVAGDGGAAARERRRLERAAAAVADHREGAVALPARRAGAAEHQNVGRGRDADRAGDVDAGGLHQFAELAAAIADLR